MTTLRESLLAAGLVTADVLVPAPHAGETVLRMDPLAHRIAQMRMDKWIAQGRPVADFEERTERGRRSE